MNEEQEITVTLPLRCFKEIHHKAWHYANESHVPKSFDYYNNIRYKLGLAGLPCLGLSAEDDWKLGPKQL